MHSCLPASTTETAGDHAEYVSCPILRCFSLRAAIDIVFWKPTMTWRTRQFLGTSWDRGLCDWETDRSHLRSKGLIDSGFLWEPAKIKGRQVDALTFGLPVMPLSAAVALPSPVVLVPLTSNNSLLSFNCLASDRVAGDCAHIRVSQGHQRETDQIASEAGTLQVRTVLHNFDYHFSPFHPFCLGNEQKLMVGTGAYGLLGR